MPRPKPQSIELPLAQVDRLWAYQIQVLYWDWQARGRTDLRSLLLSVYLQGMSDTLEAQARTKEQHDGN